MRDSGSDSTPLLDVLFTENSNISRGADVCITVDVHVLGHAGVGGRLRGGDRQRRLRINHLRQLIHYL